MEPKISEIRCGIVLAAGEGKRLKPFIHRLRGDDLPKQYVNFIGNRSILEHTLHWTEKLIPAERLFTVVGEDHLRYPEVRMQLSSRPRGTEQRILNVLQRAEFIDRLHAVHRAAHLIGAS